jgi:hypothetical protein
MTRPVFLPEENMEEIEMYFPDLSSYRYLGPEPNTLNVGWLDGIHPYPTGNTPAEFAERLLAFLKVPVRFTFGVHSCEICHNERSGDEIRVFGHDQTIYAAPRMIYHYVVDHNYSPPKEFIQAVLYGPSPDSKEYLERARECVWGEDIEA